MCVCVLFCVFLMTLSMANYVAVLFLLLSTQCFLSAHCRHFPSNQGAIGDVFDVLNYGAAGDGHTDDTQVRITSNCMRTYAKSYIRKL